MKRAIKIKQNQRRRQQRESFDVAKASFSQRQENDKSFCCTQQDDNTDYVSDFRNHISPKMAREMNDV